MLEQVNCGWSVARDELQDRIYQGVLKMSPALTVLRGSIAQKLGDTILMYDGKAVTLDRELRVRGADVSVWAHQAVEAMRPSFGFMSGTSHFAAEVLSVGYDAETEELLAYVIWGVA